MSAVECDTFMTRELLSAENAAFAVVLRPFFFVQIKIWKIFLLFLFTFSLKLLDDDNGNLMDPTPVGFQGKNETADDCWKKKQICDEFFMKKFRDEMKRSKQFKAGGDNHHLQSLKTLKPDLFIDSFCYWTSTSPHKHFSSKCNILFSLPFLNLFMLLILFHARFFLIPPPFSPSLIFYHLNYITFTKKS